MAGLIRMDKLNLWICHGRLTCPADQSTHHFKLFYSGYLLYSAIVATTKEDRCQPQSWANRLYSSW